MLRDKFLAWCVHCYTALGLVAAAGMAVFIVRGDQNSFHYCVGLMIISTFIDTTDGLLARRARVKNVLPQFDGRRLDDIIDFQTYTSLPLLFIWRAGILPANLSWLLLLPLLASVYGFSQSNAKTGDNFFLGFPSYWNVVAIYLYWLQLPLWVSLSLIITLSLLTFVPSLYIYSTRGGPFSRSINLLYLLWTVALVVVVMRVFDDPKPLIWASLAFPLYYFIVSWWITLQRWFNRRRQSAQSEHRLGSFATETSTNEDC